MQQKEGVKMKKINLDNAAASPLEPAVLGAMMPFFTEHYGNPSNGHELGNKPRKALEEARIAVARLINAEPREIIFTASASESNNLAIKGLVAANRGKGNHIISSAVEHFSVLNQLKTLEKEGFSVTLLPVDSFGLVNPKQLEQAITDKTILVSIQTANPEIGTIQPLQELVAVAESKGVPFHTDAAAAVGWIKLDMKNNRVALLSLAGDQFYGPKGSAALYVSKKNRIRPLIEGGIQERGLRAGTENIPALIGLGMAAKLAYESMEERVKATIELREKLKESLLKNVPHLHLNGHPQQRLPHNLNFSVEFVEGEALLMRLNMAGIYVSSGSSCTSQALKSSHVLAAIGLPPELAQGSLSFTLGRQNSAEEIPYVAEQLAAVADLLRKMSPLYHQYLKEAQNNA
jgi:cysteine desulfurase